MTYDLQYSYAPPGCLCSFVVKRVLTFSSLASMTMLFSLSCNAGGLDSEWHQFGSIRYH